jgi:hypothetical protein
MTDCQANEECLTIESCFLKKLGEFSYLLKTNRQALPYDNDSIEKSLNFMLLEFGKIKDIYETFSKEMKRKFESTITNLNNEIFDYSDLYQKATDTILEDRFKFNEGFCLVLPMADTNHKRRLEVRQGEIKTLKCVNLKIGKILISQFVDGKWEILKDNEGKELVFEKDFEVEFRNVKTQSASKIRAEYSQGIAQPGLLISFV